MTTTGPTTSGPDGPPRTLLTISVDPGDGTPPAEWTLQCDPPGGTHPDSAAACGALGTVDPAVLMPVPPDAVCAQIYGGPETATIRGVWDGADVDASFARTNACEIARWDAVAGMFPG